MRSVIAVLLSLTVTACGSFSPLEYVSTGLKFASNPAELVENYYKKINEDRRLARERKNRVKLKQELDLQECGAVYYWLNGYYKRHGGIAAKDRAALVERYQATGIDRNFLNRVVHGRVGDGRAKKSIAELPDLHWVMNIKRLCDEIYIDRLVTNPQFIRPTREPDLYKVEAR